MSKRLFDKLVDEGASSPATAAPTSFAEIFQISGRKNCKVRMLLWKMGFSAAKILPRPPYTPPGTIVIREGCGPLELSMAF